MSTARTRATGTRSTGRAAMRRAPCGQTGSGRRGNHEVMIRGTFANIRLLNQLGTEGGITRDLPGGEQLTIFDAAGRYAAEGVPLLVIAGNEYGSGSSRDWAAKDTALPGVRAVLAAPQASQGTPNSSPGDSSATPPVPPAPSPAPPGRGEAGDREAQTGDRRALPPRRRRRPHVHHEPFGTIMAAVAR